MRRRVAGAAGVAIVCAALSGAGAAEMTADEINSVIVAVGCRQQLAQASAVLTVICDEGQVIANMPGLQASGMINRDLKQAYINTHHISLTGFATTMVTELALMANYQEHATLDALRVEGVMAALDDYGNASSRPIFSFGFDRATYVRINWDNFDTTKLPNVTKRFSYSPWYQAAVMREGF